MQTIKRGDVLTFKPEWSDPVVKNVTFRAIENEDEGRVKVVAELGLGLNPKQVVRVAWVATVNGKGRDEVEDEKQIAPQQAALGPRHRGRPPSPGEL